VLAAALTVLFCPPFSARAMAQPTVVTISLEVSRVSSATNNALPADTMFRPVQLSEDIYVESWTEIDASTCKDISTGNYTVTTAPKYGTLRFNVENFRIPPGYPCAGVVEPFAVAHYTWKTTTTAAAFDFFHLHWSTPDGTSQDNDWAAEFIPTAETTKFAKWAAAQGHPTLGQWSQTLAPSTVAYKGAMVEETDPGGGGPDTCWFKGSIFAPFTKITGGKWAVTDGDIWQFDSIGWLPGAVDYYRKQGRAPCRTTFPQQMRIQFPTGDLRWFKYGSINKLGGSFTKTTVTSSRAGQSRTRTWP
jgi:hypothetical protein